MRLTRNTMSLLSHLRYIRPIFIAYCTELGSAAAVARRTSGVEQAGAGQEGAAAPERILHSGTDTSLTDLTGSRVIKTPTRREGSGGNTKTGHTNCMC